MRLCLYLVVSGSLLSASCGDSGPACEQSVVTLNGASAQEGLSFSLSEVLEDIAPIDREVVWGDAEGVPPAVAGTSSRLRLEVQVAGDVELVRTKRNEGWQSDYELGCADHLRAVTSVTLSTEDGHLNEVFEEELRAYEVDNAVLLLADLDPSALSGSLEVPAANSLSFRLSREGAEVQVSLSALFSEAVGSSQEASGASVTGEGLQRFVPLLELQ